MSTEIALLIADVYELAGALRRVGETTAASEGQTQARWQLLSAISDHPETVPRAARRLGITRQAVQRVANELAQLGLADYVDNPDHRTSPLLVMTEAGREKLEAINRRAAAMNRLLASRVGDSAVSEMRSGVRRLLAAVDEG